MFNCNSSDIGIVRALLQGIILGYYRSVEGFIQVVFNGLVLKDYFQQTKQGRLPLNTWLSSSSLQHLSSTATQTLQVSQLTHQAALGALHLRPIHLLQLGADAVTILLHDHGVEFCNRTTVASNDQLASLVTITNLLLERRRLHSNRTCRVPQADAPRSHVKRADVHISFGRRRQAPDVLSVRDVKA